LGKVGVGECDCDDIAWVVAHYPVLLDSERWEEVATVIVGRLHEMSSTLPPGGSAQLHVRMPPSTPVSLFKVLYEVAYSVNWIQPKYVFVRALHVPS
ncbi:MAG: hypothetical protein ONB23_13515, partial [candidate division KSB1 bacterium]|nr:hypothetical protein [candidate division KSB1 bacterium]